MDSSKIENNINNPSEYEWIWNNVLGINLFEGDIAMKMLQKFVCSCSEKSPCINGEICFGLFQNLIFAFAS